MDSEVWQNAGLWKVWTWALLSAAWKPHYVAVPTGRGETTVHLKRGQLVYGRYAAARKLGLKPSTVRNHIGKLTCMGNLDTQSHGHYSILTVCNYDSYQGTDNGESAPIGQAKDKQRTQHKKGIEEKPPPPGRETGNSGASRRGRAAGGGGETGQEKQKKKDRQKAEARLRQCGVMVRTSKNLSAAFDLDRIERHCRQFDTVRERGGNITPGLLVRQIESNGTWDLPRSKAPPPKTEYSIYVCVKCKKEFVASGRSDVRLCRDGNCRGRSERTGDIDESQVRQVVEE